MKQIRVLLVEESKQQQRMLAELLTADGGVALLAPTSDLAQAREWLLADEADILLLGAATLYAEGRSLLQESPVPVIITTPYDPQAIDAAARALGDGACDSVVLPDRLDSPEQAELLKAELRSKLWHATRTRISRREPIKNPRILHFKAKRVGLPVIAVGGSTGAVPALRELLAPLPTIAPPMVITLGVPAPLVRCLVRQMNPETEITLMEATDGAPLQNGYAYVVSAERPLTVRKQGAELFCHLDSTQKPHDSIDRLFHSVAEAVGKDAFGILLSGSGEDGAKGLANIRSKGGYTIVQDEATSMAGDLPRAAVKLLMPSAVLPLDDIAKHVLDCSQIGKRRTPSTPKKHKG